MNKKENKNKVSYLLTLGVLLVPAVASASDVSATKIIDLTNAERVERGFKPLNINNQLTQAAGSKSSVMLAKNYFDHYAHGISPWSIILNNGYDYSVAGENLAMDFNSSEAMLNAWMNSPMHKQNILNTNFEDIGVGVVKGSYTEANGVSHETVMVTQMFARKKPVVLSITSKILSRIFGIF